MRLALVGDVAATEAAGLGGHRGRVGQRGPVEVGLGPVEAVADVARVAVAAGQVPQPEAVADQLEDRLMAVDPVVHAEGLALRAPAGVRGHGHGGDAEAHLAEVGVQVGGGALVGHARRAHVVEEAAPLVVDDEQGPAAVVRRGHEGVDHVSHERLAQPDVAQRVLVGRQPVPSPAVAERRIDDRDVGQRARRAVGVVARHGVRPAQPARPVDRRERDVGVVVAGAHAASQGAVEDRLELVAALGHVDLVDVRRLARRRGRPLVVAVGERGPQQRAEVAVVQRVRAGRLVDEPQLAACRSS